MFPHSTVEYPDGRVAFNLLDGPLAGRVVAFIGPRPSDITGCEIGHACWIVSDGGQVGKTFRVWQQQLAELATHTYRIINRQDCGENVDLSCRYVSSTYQVV